MSKMYERYQMPQDNSPLMDRTSRDAHSFTERDLSPFKPGVRRVRVMPDKNAAHAHQIDQADLLRAKIASTKSEEAPFSGINIPENDDHLTTAPQQQYRQQQKKNASRIFSGKR